MKRPRRRASSSSTTSSSEDDEDRPQARIAKAGAVSRTESLKDSQSVQGSRSAACERDDKEQRLDGARIASSAKVVTKHGIDGSGEVIANVIKIFNMNVNGLLKAFARKGKRLENLLEEQGSLPFYQKRHLQVRANNGLCFLLLFLD